MKFKEQQKITYKPVITKEEEKAIDTALSFLEDLRSNQGVQEDLNDLFYDDLLNSSSPSCVEDLIADMSYYLQQFLDFCEIEK